jgi:hypothetical protein
MLPYGRHTVSKVFGQLAHFLVKNQVQLTCYRSSALFMCNFDEDNFDFVGGMFTAISST